MRDYNAKHKKKLRWNASAVEMCNHDAYSLTFASLLYLLSMPFYAFSLSFWFFYLHLHLQKFLLHKSYMYLCAMIWLLLGKYLRLTEPPKRGAFLSGLPCDHHVHRFRVTMSNTTHTIFMTAWGSHSAYFID